MEKPPHESREQAHPEAFRDRLRQADMQDWIPMVYERAHGDIEQMKSMVLRVLDPYLSVFTGDSEVMRSSIIAAITENCDNYDEFTAALTSVLEDLFAGIDRNNRSYYEVRREAFLSYASESLIEVNEVLYYEIQDQSLVFHISPADHLSPRALLEQIRRGLRDVASVIEQNEAIQTIQGQSWLISRYPKIVQSLGFTITDYDPTSHDRHNIDGDIHGTEATIDRHTFLALYGDESQ